jgi:hypothetical protein
VLRDRDGTALVTYEPGRGLSVSAPSGDLRLSAPRGRVIIDAGEDIALSARGALDVQADTSHWQSREARITAEQLVTRCEQIAQVVGRWELRAQRVVETATDVYREVEGLAQTRAGRVRELVAGAYQLFAGRASIAADEDASIDGKRVLLG